VAGRPGAAWFYVLVFQTTLIGQQVRVLLRSNELLVFERWRCRLIR